MKKITLALVLSLFVIPFSKVKGQNQYELFFLRNQLDSLIEEAERNLQSNHPDTTDYYWLAVALKRKGDMNMSVNVLKEGLELYNNNVRLNKLLADLYYENGDYTEAFPILKKYPNDNECMMKQVSIHEFTGRYTDAVLILQELCRRDTSNVLYLKHLGDNYYQLNDFANASLVYSKVLSLNPYNQPAAYRLSRIYLKEEKHQKSIEVCEPILEKDSTNKRFLKQAAYVHYAWKKYEKAATLFSDILIQKDTSAFVCKYLGISELKNHAFHSGRMHLLEAYKRDTNDFETCFFLGRAYLNSSSPGQGLYYLDKADSLLQPDSLIMSALYLEKKSVYGALDQNAQAIACYQSAYNYNPKPEYLFYMGSIYQNSLGNKSKALEYYRWFLSELPPKEHSEHEIGKKQVVVSLRKAAEDKIKKLKEELFFEGKLQ